MMRLPITFPVPAEIVSSGLLITLKSGENEFHPSDPVPATPRARVLRTVFPQNPKLPVKAVW